MAIQPRIMLVVLVLIAFGCSLVYLMLQKRFKFWEDRGFISATASPADFPFGNMKGVGTKMPSFQKFDEFYIRFKGKAQALGMYMFLSPTLMILDLELLKNIFIRDFASFHDRGFYSNKQDDPLSANLLTLEGQEWKDRRTKLSPIFTSGKMKMMFELVDLIGDKFVKALGKEIKISENFNMQQILAKYSTDVISSIAFGIESNCLEDPNSEFYKQGHRLFDLKPLEFLKLIFTSGAPDLSRKLHFHANPKEPSDFFQKVFIQTIREREAGGVQRNDFVQLLLKIRESVSLSEDEMAAEAFIFFVGGFETSSTALTFGLYELAQNPDITQKLRREIEDGLGENDGKLTYDMLFQFKYLDCVVKEILRKYPVIPVMLRKCTKEYQIPGTNLTIPEKQIVLIPFYSIHHDSEYYPSPDVFDPERFSPENSESRNPLTFLAFGEGPRNCVGERFGLLQVKLALVKLLTNFDFSVCDKTTIPMKFKAAAPFLSPVDGMVLKVKRLN